MIMIMIMVVYLYEAFYFIIKRGIIIHWWSE